LSLLKSERKIYKISELAQALNQSLEKEFSEIWVQGEISGFKRHSGGHYFFSLKDEKAKIQAVMFRFQALYLKFTPEHGLEVRVRGRLSFYEQRGEIRLIADFMEPVGIGALQLAFEQLKARLEKEGLFALERKKPMPEFPKRIAIITSLTGAVIKDMRRVLKEMQAKLEIVIIPSRVQGEGAEFDLAKAIELANLPELATPLNKPALDLIVLARGGGSLEDLWAFNTEFLAQAISRSKIPIISAVGHEGDWTIADFVADLRAPTPTAGAQIIAQAQLDKISRLNQLETNLKKLITQALLIRGESLRKFFYLGFQLRGQLKSIGKELSHLTQQLGYGLNTGFRRKRESFWLISQALYQLSPLILVQKNEQGVSRLEAGLKERIKTKLYENQERVSHFAGRLQTLSPLATLSRGYSIAKRKLDGQVIKTEQEVELGEIVELILGQGELETRVQQKREKNRLEKKLEN